MSPIFPLLQWLHTQVVPDVHLSAQSSDLDDALAQEVVRLSLQALLYSWLDVIVFVPNSQLDTVWWVVALAVETEDRWVTLTYVKKYLKKWVPDYYSVVTT